MTIRTFIQLVQFAWCLGRPLALSLFSNGSYASQLLGTKWIASGTLFNFSMALHVPIGPAVALAPKAPITLWNHEIKVEFEVYTDYKTGYGREYQCWLTCDSVARIHGGSLAQVPLESFNEMASRSLMKALVTECADLNYHNELFWKPRHERVWEVWIRRSGKGLGDEKRVHGSSVSLNPNDVVRFIEVPRPLPPPKTPERTPKRRRLSLSAKTPEKR